MSVHRQERNGSAAALAVLLIGLGIAALWWAVAPSVLGVERGAVLDGALAPAVVAAPEDAALAEGVRISNRLQTSQPRDPFRPLISDTPDEDGGADDGEDPEAPDRLEFTVVSVEDVAGVLRAEVTIDGVTYTVGVGDTFAGTFKVVSLTEGESGVFMNGDNTFEASIGQTILK